MALNSNLSHKSSLDRVSVCIQEGVYQAEDHWTLILVQVNLIQLELDQVPLFLLEVLSDLLVQGWNASLNVVNQYFIQAFTQVWNSELFTVC